jgi:hypothetical protein
LAQAPEPGEALPDETPTPQKRRLVLCLDGTWNNAYREKRREDGTEVLKPSNPLKFCRSVKPRTADGVAQVVFYDTGVGSLTEFPGTSNRIVQWVDNKLGGAFGAGFETNIEEALTFLAYNYQPGDEVYIFGFSRGAATARGVTRFIDWAGGVPQKADVYYLPILFRAFVTGHGAPEAFRPKQGLKPFHPVDVHLLGVWDTVMALGSRFKAVDESTAEAGRSFYVGTRPARCVLHARQALAVDERRFDFRPDVWTGREDHQSLEQRWFPGAHSNVGGGYLDDGLANGSLHWFKEEARALGLEVDEAFLRRYSRFPQDRLYDSRTGLYRFLETVRFRRGKGKRSLLDYPAGAHLSLDASVIHRLIADPDDHDEMDAPYRPENVLQFLASQEDLDAYLASIPNLKEEHRELPTDILQHIDQLRSRNTGGR